jgi:ATP-binding cassette subfamily B protein
LAFDDRENGRNLDWNQMAQEFLYWSNQGWDTGSVINLNPTAYSLTAKESVAMGRVEEEIDIDKVKNAAVHSGANEFISEWKNQYDEQLGSEFNGIAPSQGQEQKIAIARALYRGGYVLVLDEPTASVDALSEADIFEKIRTSTENRTLILISHRFNTVINMDRIIVIEHGAVVEEGSHAKLMKKKGGVYAKMFNSQAAGYSAA